MLIEESHFICISIKLSYQNRKEDKKIEDEIHDLMKKAEGNIFGRRTLQLNLGKMILTSKNV